ncbi:hypothetical protein PsYK624_030510 [Phanerochaete sordida]|uniref:Uncharacterized protein n=1 Tax=Phanerochaete sordida TaxID=48140 RepID=A0A9P3LAG5_9APHY|nr:hypothetical protein PsYK624_030510 [Phanerochaete sordida]
MHAQNSINDHKEQSKCSNQTIGELLLRALCLSTATRWKLRRSPFFFWTGYRSRCRVLKHMQTCGRALRVAINSPSKLYRFVPRRLHITSVPNLSLASYLTGSDPQTLGPTQEHAIVLYLSMALPLPMYRTPAHAALSVRLSNCQASAPLRAAILIGSRSCPCYLRQSPRTSWLLLSYCSEVSVGRKLNWVNRRECCFDDHAVHLVVRIKDHLPHSL